MKSETVCYCSNVSKADIIMAIEQGAKTLQDIREQTNACTIGKCKELNPTKKCCSSKIIDILNEYAKEKNANG